MKVYDPKSDKFRNVKFNEDRVIVKAPGIGNRTESCSCPFNRNGRCQHNLNTCKFGSEESAVPSHCPLLEARFLIGDKKDPTLVKLKRPRMGVYKQNGRTKVFEEHKTLRSPHINPVSRVVKG